MRRIPEEEVEANREKSLVTPFIVGVVCLFALFWAYNHISNGCTGITDVFTYCSGSTGSVVITK